MVSKVSPYRLEEWVIDPRRCLASRHGESAHLEPKVNELLNYLAARPGEVISRSELLEALWPGVVVGDDVITNAVAKLRKTLGEDPKSRSLIETIPKRGYRLVAAVGEVPEDPVRTSRHAWGWLVVAGILAIGTALTIRLMNSGEVQTKTASAARAGLPLPARPSVAVLPFANNSDDSEQNYFVDGLSEDLITDLSRVSGLFVIARNSSFAYRDKSPDISQIGHELGVRFIVQGSVRRVEETLRINVQLIDTLNGGHVWAERYDGNRGDVFRFQQMIAARIVEALAVQRTPSERDYAAFQETQEPRAYEAFLKGWAAYRRGTSEDFAKAIVHFESAIELDSAYGRAWAALAAVHWEVYRNRWHRRLDISPLSRAWQKASECLERSMIAPTPLAHKVASEMLTTNRRYNEAISEAQRAIAIDSNDPLGHVALAEVLVFADAPEKAEELVRKAMRLDPQDSARYLFALGKSQLAMGKADDAVVTLEQATHRIPGDRLVWMALISAYGSLGQIDKAKQARQSLEELQRRDKLVSFTIGHAREHWPFKTSNVMERFLDGLRKGGVPEW